MTTPALFLLLALTMPIQPERLALENRLTSISVQERERFTIIEVQNTVAPTFSVFKLEDPPRLFVDLPNTTVEFDHTLDVYNGVVNQVGTMQFRNQQTLTGRIIVNLRRDALYTAETTGSTLRIMVDGSERTATAPDDKALKELRAREDEAKNRIQGYEQKEKDLEAAILARQAELESLAARGRGDLAAPTKVETAHDEAVAKEPEHEAALRGQVDALKAELAATDAYYRAKLDELAATLARTQADYQARLDQRGLETEALRARVAGLEARLKTQEEGNANALQTRIASLEADIQRARQEKATGYAADLATKEQALAALKATGDKKRKTYSGKRISVSTNDTNIRDVLAFLAQEGGVTIVAPDDVQGKVSFRLEDVPWDLALDMILKGKGLDSVKEGSVYRVVPLEVQAASPGR